MSTRDLYVQDPGDPVWKVPATGAARFSWDYDDGRERLLALYQKGKDKQWDANLRIDWGLEVDPRIRSAPRMSPCPCTAPSTGTK